MKTYKCDIASIDELRDVQKQIKADFGGHKNMGKGKGSSSAAEAPTAEGGHGGEVTMVLNIAGINNKSLILDLDEKKVERMLNVNLKSHFLTAIVFLPNMVSAYLTERWVAPGMDHSQRSLRPGEAQERPLLVCWLDHELCRHHAPE